MTDLDRVTTWFNLCPYLQTLAMYIDTTPDWPISAGLYPKGQVVLKETWDVTGQYKSRIRQVYVLRCALQEGAEAARRLQQIQNWVFTQNINGATPGLGDKETVQGMNGRLERASQVGKSIYALTLTVEFERISEGV